MRQKEVILQLIVWWKREKGKEKNVDVKEHGKIESEKIRTNRDPCITAEAAAPLKLLFAKDDYKFAF